MGQNSNVRPYLNSFGFIVYEYVEAILIKEFLSGVFLSIFNVKLH